MASSLNGTGLTFSSGQTLNSPPVTSVATGNGLSGGTITTTGTLVIAAPAANTVGSYAFVAYNNNGTARTFGTNYAAGTGLNQLQAATYIDPSGTSGLWVSNSLSGTWKWLGATVANVATGLYTAIAVRVS
jgi:hypothetical protein